MQKKKKKVQLAHLDLFLSIIALFYALIHVSLSKQHVNNVKLLFQLRATWISCCKNSAVLQFCFTFLSCYAMDRYGERGISE